MADAKNIDWKGKSGAVRRRIYVALSKFAVETPMRVSPARSE